MDFYVSFLFDLTILFQLQPLKACEKVTFSTIKRSFYNSLPFFFAYYLSFNIYEAELFK